MLVKRSERKMPTYEYRCERCGHEFETFQMISEPPVETCQVCRGKVHRKISGGAGFLFKGSGSYITDYRSKDYKQKAKQEKESQKSAESSKADSKSKQGDGASTPSTTSKKSNATSAKAS